MTCLVPFKASGDLAVGGEEEHGLRNVRNTWAVFLLVCGSRCVLRTRPESKAFTASRCARVLSVPQRALHQSCSGRYAAPKTANRHRQLH